MIPAAFRRRAAVEPDSPIDVLSELAARRDSMATRASAVRQRAADLDAAEATSRTALEAAAAAGEDTAAHAEALAQIAARRVAIGHERTAVEAALGTAQGAVEAEEKRLADLETDARLEGLRTVALAAQEAYASALIDCGVQYEALLLAEDRLESGFLDAGRPSRHGFRTPAMIAHEKAEEAARERLRRAIADGAGHWSHLSGPGDGPIPHARLSKF